MYRRSFIRLGSQLGTGLLLSHFSVLGSPFELSDNQKYLSKIRMLQRVHDEAIRLGFEIHSPFYNRWKLHRDTLYFYLYISNPRKIEGPSTYSFQVFNTETEAAGVEQIYQSDGYQTMIYKTAGNSAAELSEPLLNYYNESIAYIAFHEAGHLHIRSHSPFMPYIFEEACADVLGIEGIKHFSQIDPAFSFHSALNMERRFDKIHDIINIATAFYENHLYKTPQDLYKQCLSNIQSEIPSHDNFMKDRYDYEVNNAYLLRNRDYCKYYEPLRELFRLMGFKNFLAFISGLTYDEKTTLKKIREITG